MKNIFLIKNYSFLICIVISGFSNSALATRVLDFECAERTDHEDKEYYKERGACYSEGDRFLQSKSCTTYATQNSNNSCAVINKSEKKVVVNCKLNFTCYKKSGFERSDCSQDPLIVGDLKKYISKLEYAPGDVPTFCDVINGRSTLDKMFKPSPQPPPSNGRGGRGGGK